MTLENPPWLNSQIPMSKPQTMRLSKGEITPKFYQATFSFEKSFLAGKNDFPNSFRSVPQRTLRTRKPPPRPHWPVPSRCELLLWHVALLPNTAAFQTTEKERWAMNGFLQNTNVFGWWTCFHTHPREMEEINKTIPWQKTSQIWWFWGRFQPQKLSAETCVSGF